MFHKIKMASVVVAIVFFLLSLLAVLQYYRFQSLLFEVNSTRIAIPSESLKNDIERSLSVGLALQSNAAIKSMLETMRKRNPGFLAIRLIDAKADEPTVFWESGKPLSGEQLRELVNNHRKTRQDMSFDTSSRSNFIQVWSIHDPIGAVVAKMIVCVDATTAQGLLSDARSHLFRYWLMLCAATLACLAPILIYLFSNLDRLARSASDVLRGDSVSNVRSADFSRRDEVDGLVAQMSSSEQSVQPSFKFSNGSGA